MPDYSNVNRDESGGLYYVDPETGMEVSGMLKALKQGGGPRRVDQPIEAKLTRGFFGWIWFLVKWSFVLFCVVVLMAIAVSQ